MIRHLIGVAPQENALYPELSAAENLRFFGSLYDVPSEKLESRIADLLGFIALQDRSNDLVVGFSGGMKRRLNLAAALVHEPELILLDEPTSGVDPQSREEILDLVRSLRNDGKSIIYTTHYMEEAEGLCDELAILEKGRFVASGTLHDLLHDVDFSEIIQLKGVSTQDDLSRLASLPGIGHWERSEDVMRMYVSRAADYMEPLEKILNADTSLELKITPISLENLFLHLTGRKAHAGGKTGMIARVSIILVICSLLVSSASGANPQTTGAVSPLDCTRTILEQARAIVAGNQTHEQKVAALSAVFARFLDTDAMGREALGQHWSSFTPAQQQEFLPLFRELIEDVYVQHLLLFQSLTLCMRAEVDRQ